MTDYHYLWTAYTAEVLVCWEVQEWPDARRNRQMVSLHVYGEVDSKIVRAIPFAIINAAEPTDYPCWLIEVTTDEVPPPPTYRETTEAWQSRTKTHSLSGTVAITTTTSGTINVERKGVKVGPREPGEDVDAFYRRVADAYRMFADQSGKPTTQMATLAGVEKGTAARWVHQARQRGFLEPTTRGKVRR